MINYSLKCADGHSFDSWFQSAAAFDKLSSAGLVTCSFCGNSKVEKAIMAPRVRTGRNAVSITGESERAETAGAPPPSEASKDQDGKDAQVKSRPAGPGALSTPTNELAGKMEQALGELRRRVEKNSDYVGEDFASEARAMHLGETPERAIYGEAKPDEAKALIDEGIPVLPLPFGRNRKTN